MSERPRYDWTAAEHLLARVSDQLQANTYAIGALIGFKTKGGKNPMPKPVPIERPGDPGAGQRAAGDGKRPSSSSAEIAGFFRGPSTTMISA